MTQHFLDSEGENAQLSLCEDGDEGEGEQQVQDVQEVLRPAPQLLHGITNSPSELPIEQSFAQHRLLLVLLQEATGERSHSPDRPQVSPERAEHEESLTCRTSLVLNSLDRRSTDRFS